MTFLGRLLGGDQGPARGALLLEGDLLGLLRLNGRIECDGLPGVGCAR